jgi:kinesin family protein 3/17
MLNSGARGITPRLIQEIFTAIKRLGLAVNIYASFLQIYNEKVFDLFHDVKKKKTPTRDLPIREEPVAGIYVEGLSEYLVTSDIECISLLKRGEKNRVVRGTFMNQNSSRSHSLFQLVL